MKDWRKHLRFDPIQPLLSSGNEPVRYFAQRDLLGKQVGPAQQLWDLPEVRRILKKQQADGSWPRAGEKKHAAINYGLIETWRQFRFLIEMYGFTRGNVQAQRAAEYLFSCQTAEGDIRGMLANQYATYSTGAIMALLIKAGYADDPRIEEGFQWLLAMRQADQGWSTPLITQKLDRKEQYRLTSEYAEPIKGDRLKPFSHNCTGMILRAFASHEKYRKSDAAGKAARLLKSRFFQPDAYSSYKNPGYWIRFEYPFWWNNLVAALDSISFIGISKSDAEVNRALAWLAAHQEKNGLWRTTYSKAHSGALESKKVKDQKLWITLAICRIFKRINRWS